MELAFIAGLFEGEGCVRINRSLRKQIRYGKKVTMEVYSLFVTIGNTDPRLVYPLKDMFGGSVSIRIRKDPRHRPFFCWIISSNEALNFLEGIHPWLVSKADQVDIAITFQKSKTPRGIYNKRNGKSREEREIERAQFKAITALKFIRHDPTDIDMAANSGDNQNGQSRAKQPQSAVGVCND
jgi:hypothetical protein